MGELVVTGLSNWVMPLIRYRTDDLAVPSDETDCACGRGLSLISSVEGRVIDVLRMPDGKIVPPTALTLLFDKAQAMGISRAQIVQENVDLVVVKLVPRGEQLDTTPLENDLRSMMGDSIGINFETVEHIPRTSSGKFKFVVSKIAQ
jgi:phenylacetate-CoA ligase